MALTWRKSLQRQGQGTVREHLVIHRGRRIQLGGSGIEACYVVTPTLKVVQTVLKCDVTLLSIYNSDWSQKGKFNSWNVITLDV
jgi:hypothetical protein